MCANYTPIYRENGVRAHVPKGFYSTEFYAGKLIEYIDHHLGRVFEHLEKAGCRENTLVIFFSDNGANGAQMHQYPQTDQAWVDRNSDNRYDNVGRRFSRVATGPGWAQASMTPYRLFKGFPAEGGIRSPLIVSGPPVAKPGTRSDAFTHVMDVAATILDAANVAHPGDSYKGRKVHALRGRSMLPLLRGRSKYVYENDTAVSWELFGFRAVRKGDFKLLWLPEPYGAGDWQLYDLSTDPGELNDLSRRRADLRAEMIDVWTRYAKEAGVVLPPGGSLSL